MVLYDFTASQQLRHGALASQQLCHGGLARCFPMAPCNVPASLRWCPVQVSSSATVPRPAAAPLRCPGQQQTSSVGEKYSGLASNLAYLGRIC